ncbi:hypothetical protein KCU62_g9851, partial [Aureobasidium sp. EXF-3399]
MSAQLSNLPSEVIEMVVCLLDYQEICNLRLVSRAIDVASTQARYKSFFGCKTVELDSTAILRPAAITKYSYFVGLLQDLTLTGTEKGQVTDRFSSRDADRLCMALRNLRKLHEQSKQYGLRSLTTGVTEEASTPSRVVSRSTPRSGAGASAVRTTLRVVNDSDIPIEKIDLLYHSSAYSVPCCIFKGLFEPIQPSTNWSILRSLSLSLTHHANNGAEAGLEDTDYDTFDFAVRESAEAGTRRVQALVHFFSLIPNIEELSLHWYDKRLKSLAFTVAEAIENYWFDQVSLVVSFHNLKHLVLRGLRLSQQTLQKVLIAPSLQQVHLEYIRLTGSLRPIIDILTGPNTAIAQFFLDDIYT